MANHIMSRGKPKFALTCLTYFLSKCSRFADLGLEMVAVGNLENMPFGAQPRKEAISFKILCPAYCAPNGFVLNAAHHLSKHALRASWRSGYAVDCKSMHPGSIPGEASIFFLRKICLLSMFLNVEI
jgi:hypothetical protein